MLATTHSIGDGMALHACLNEFYGLLGSGGIAQELEVTLEMELEKAVSAPPASFSPHRFWLMIQELQQSSELYLPPSTEDRLGGPAHLHPMLYAAASRTALSHSQRKAIVRPLCSILTLFPLLVLIPCEFLREIKPCLAGSLPLPPRKSRPSSPPSPSPRPRRRPF